MWRMAHNGSGIYAVCGFPEQLAKIPKTKGFVRQRKTFCCSILSTLF